ncbi:MAG: methylenetetrahydrofolate dehydrogenase / methenyltetrahydrofolate cyclohydrolase [Patescibacteria group bacterium]|nr:methylenetetrahydrofolate dehydrogenase / methenyltetrahydrofolate cyclohydrolase [Patescibacteria group bacterium]
MKIVEGKKIASLIKENLVKVIKEQNLQKSLAIFYVGSNPVIDNFIELKKKFGEDIGVRVRIFKYEENISTPKLIKEIKNISKDFDGVVIQLPLPAHIDKKKVLNSVPKEKDIDVLSEKKYKKFALGDFTFFPPVAGAVFEIFSFYNISLDKKKIVIVGDGLLVGRPVFDWLKASGISAKIVTEKTRNRDSLYKNADIIISGVGKANIIKKSFIKKGVILIDAGSSSEDGQIVGDISKDCKIRAQLFSTVPGGVGPITIAILFRNMLYN